MARFESRQDPRCLSQSRSWIQYVSQFTVSLDLGPFRLYRRLIMNVPAAYRRSIEGEKIAPLEHGHGHGSPLEVDYSSQQAHFDVYILEVCVPSSLLLGFYRYSWC